MWWVYALLSALFAALTAILAKIGLAGVNPELATAVRTVVILLLAWGIVWARGGLPGLQQLSGHNLLFLVLSGLATGLSWVFYFRALSTGRASQVAPIDKLSIVLTLVLAAAVLHEPMTRKTIVAAVLIVTGVLVLVLWQE